MKKELICLLLFVCSVNLQAQHVTFVGIRLGQSVSVIDRLLKQKGFEVDEVIKAYYHTRYKGDFWKYKDVAINTMVDNGIVTGISASPSPYRYGSISDYNDLVTNLDRKYGRHHNISSFFKHSDFADHDGYYWRIQGGYIVASYCYNADRSRVLFSVDYLENNNRIIVYELAKKRNTQNDL